MGKQRCLYCRNEFTPQRSTAKFCSTECRVKYHRDKKRNTVTALESATDAVLTMVRAAHVPDTSYDAIDALLALRDLLDRSIPVNRGSVWFCRKCERIVTTEFPEVGDCECDSPVWVLQEKLL